MTVAAMLNCIGSSNRHQKWCIMIYYIYRPNLIQIPLTVLRYTGHLSSTMLVAASLNLQLETQLSQKDRAMRYVN